jgi:hypothetical protein
MRGWDDELRTFISSKSILVLEIFSSRDQSLLDLRGYSEHKDPREIFSSPSAIGLMLGAGKSLEFQQPKKEPNHVLADGSATDEKRDDKLP